MARPKGPMVKQELTVEQQIAKIQQEAEQKIKELRSSLSWDKRFTTAFNSFINGEKVAIVEELRGHGVKEYFLNDINMCLHEVGLRVKYESATFDNELYAKSGVNDLVDAYDLSEYPVYTIFAVTNLKNELQGYVRVNCNYSSYNGNEYSSWSFVRMQEITCKVFTPYQP
jgi:hypothetical protein